MDQHGQDERLELLWRKLDYRDRGYLDIRSMKKGLRRMDHPLKNADNILRDVLEAMDTNRDGHITYEEFEHFIKHTEYQLWLLFHSIDRDHDGKMDKMDLKDALSTTGLAVPNAKLDEFFDQVDSDHDGVICFEEWRNFLLFIPATAPNLRNVISYYSSTVTLNPEGDVVLSDETIQSIGNTTNILYTHPGYREPLIPFDAQYLSPPQLLPVAKIAADLSYHPATMGKQSKCRETEELDVEPSLEDMTAENTRLTHYLPHAGYFAAGALSGITSRTATAPLDRLRVHLIAQTGTANEALNAAKKGAPQAALKHAGSTLVNAIKDLWAAGGIRSLFAGNGLNVVKIMPESSIKFGSYEAIKRAFAQLEGHENPKDNSPAAKFFTGGFAGMTAQAVVYPLDTLKFRVQTETVKGSKRGNALIMLTAQKMWKEAGPRAFYRGIGAGLAGMFPYAAIDLGTFETTKNYLTTRKAQQLGIHEEDAALSGFVIAAVGGFSGAVGASLVYPLNLLRTRLQTQGTASHPRTYSGLWDCTQQTIKGEGFRGLFKGLTPNLLKVVPAMSITYVVYESTKKALELP